MRWCAVTPLGGAPAYPAHRQRSIVARYVGGTEQIQMLWAG